jgi:hypothetical protein
MKRSFTAKCSKAIGGCRTRETNGDTLTLKNIQMFFMAALDLQHESRDCWHTSDNKAQQAIIAVKRRNDLTIVVSLGGEKGLSSQIRELKHLGLLSDEANTTYCIRGR